MSWLQRLIVLWSAAFTVWLVARGCWEVWLPVRRQRRYLRSIADLHEFMATVEQSA